MTLVSGYPVEDGPSGSYSVTVDIEDTTGEIQAVHIRIFGRGSLRGVINLTGKQPISFGPYTTDQNINVPKGYVMTPGKLAGTWIWDSARNGLSYTSIWTPS
jgi:hypothetical protein